MKGKPITVRRWYDPAAILEPVRIPPPCFHWRTCRSPAVCEKEGKALCGQHAAQVCGVEYPLRPPGYPPLYLTGRLAAEAMDMVEDPL